jgi:hypothetical protein
LEPTPRGFHSTPAPQKSKGDPGSLGQVTASTGDAQPTLKSLVRQWLTQLACFGKIRFHCPDGLI